MSKYYGCGTVLSWIGCLETAALTAKKNCGKRTVTVYRILGSGGKEGRKVMWRGEEEGKEPLGIQVVFLPRREWQSEEGGNGI